MSAELERRCMDEMSMIKDLALQLSQGKSSTIAAERVHVDRNLQQEYDAVRAVAITAAARAEKAEAAATSWECKCAGLQQETSKLISVCEANEKAHENLSKENKGLQQKVKGLITTCMQNENLIRDLFEERDYLEKENKRLKRQRS